MVRVFLVDAGSMLTFDMTLSFKTVGELKEAIAETCKIPVENQVLMINGGECLDPTITVCQYTAGTDTNPIFLFSTSTAESAEPSSPSIDLGSDAELEEQMQKALALPPLYNTVVTRCRLAQQFHDYANERAQICKDLVLDQHLQQQGWAAVVANLEDIICTFKTKAGVFQHNFEAYLENREHFLEILKEFTSDLELLGRIPVLEPLLRANKDKIESGVMDQHCVSLHQWITSKDNCDGHSSLDVVAENCRIGLEQFQLCTYQSLQSDIDNVVQAVAFTAMKEIKGLEERLYGLDKMMSEALKLVTHQAETSQAFSQNKTRAANIGDASILPDLCASHRDQLKVMLVNHKQLRDVHRRCSQAKIELSKNLHIRLSWIMVVEGKLMEVDNRLVIYHENLKRLKRNLEVLQQIHMAPNVYLSSVVEVVRRRAFSKEFLKWSKGFSQQAADLHRKEMYIRREFFSRMGNHFLVHLFPGMNDWPPPYAVDAPEEFDAALPDIQPADIEALKALLPNMAASLEVPEVDVMPNGAVGASNPKARSLPSSQDLACLADSGPNVELLTGRECYLSALTNVQDATATAAYAVPEKVPKMELLLDSPRDERDPDESEPDTEEFEKVDGGVAVNEAGEAREVSGNRASGSVPSVSNTALPLPLPTAPADGPCLPYPAPLSPNDGDRISASDDSCTACSSLQDFVTADFYIDESMPSSYTESNGAAGMGWGGARGHATKGHHVIVAELQHKLEEKSAAITQLQEDTSQSRQQLHDLEDRLRQMQQLENEAVHTLRHDVNAARQSVLQTRDDFVCYLVTLSGQISDVIGLVQHRVDSDRDKVIKEMVSKAQVEHQAAVDYINKQLEIESEKLNVAHNEIQRGQEQLQRSNELTEKMCKDAEEKFGTQKQLILEEHHETIKKMTLEHELELEGLRDEHRRECIGFESLLRDAQEDLSNKISELEILRQAQCLEQDRFSKMLQEEVDKLTSRLQEEFLMREQSSIEKSVEAAKRASEEEIKWLRQNNRELSEACDRKEEQMSCMAKDFDARTDQQIKELRESLVKEHKQEMEGLRARFRLAFNAAGMERSSSECSLEKIERPDSADPSRIEQQVYTLKSELEEKDAIIFEMEQKHQREIEELAQQSKKARNESLRHMRTSLTAEKQVVFNEAVNKATAEKEATIQELKLELKTLREELQDERLLNARMKLKEESFTFSLSSERSESSPVLSRPDSGNFHMVSPVTPRRSESSGLLGVSVVSPVLEQPAEMETENNLLGEASGLGASVFVSPASEQPQESEADEGSLSASTTTVSAPDKVSVYTCNVGDMVILLYDEGRKNYVVFTASSTYHFLHHDCLEDFSLSQSTSGERCNWLLAQVTSKEYCQARKEQNRFGVSRGTRFYRVHAKPVPPSPLRRSQSATKKKLSNQTGGGSL